MKPQSAEFTVNSHNPEETGKIAKAVAGTARAGDVFALNGTLSAGKTAFARAFAAGLGIEEPVTSPTFPIIQEYDHTPPLYHMDLYRLHSSEDAIDIGAEEMMYGDGICLIEWPDRAEDLLPPSTIHLSIEITGELERKLTFRGSPQRIEEIHNELQP